MKKAQALQSIQFNRYIAKGKRAKFCKLFFVIAANLNKI